MYYLLILILKRCISAVFYSAAKKVLQPLKEVKGRCNLKIQRLTISPSEKKSSAAQLQYFV